MSASIEPTYDRDVCEWCRRQPVAVELQAVNARAYSREPDRARLCNGCLKDASVRDGRLYDAQSHCRPDW